MARPPSESDEAAEPSGAECGNRSNSTGGFIQTPDGHPASQYRGARLAMGVALSPFPTRADSRIRDANVPDHRTRRAMRKGKFTASK